MRESQFIDQNKEKWHEFEKIIRNSQKDPEKLSNLFVQITEDLSYARTFYPNRTVRFYLNHLSRQIFSKIYRSRALSFKRFWQFWSDELPFVIYNSRRQLRLSLVIFTLAMVLGVLSSIHDNTFPQLMLGEGYIQMTIDNIEQGDPMAVYKSMPGGSMFLYITWNNIRVAFKVFLFGILAGIGSFYILILNALMLGAFQYIFFEHGLLADALITIWQHGTLEIASIVIAGAAGFTLGSGILFPGTYSRIEAFRLSAYRGMRILLGLVPIFIMAGFIEGFITRQTDAHLVLRLAVIIASLSFIIFYFIWLPWHKNRKNLFRDYPPDRVPPSPQFSIRQGIYTNAAIIKDGFTFIKCHFTTFLATGIVAALISFALLGFVYSDIFTPYLSFGKMEYNWLAAPFIYLEDMLMIFEYDEAPLVAISFILMFTVLTHSVMKRLNRHLGKRMKKPVKKFFRALPVVALANIPFFLLPLPAIIFSLLLMPFWLSAIYAIYLNEDGKGVARSAIWQATQFYRRFFSILFISVLISVLLMMIFAMPVMQIYTGLIAQHIDALNLPDNMPYMIYLILTGVGGVFVLFPFVLINGALKKLSFDEITTAHSLIRYFENLGEERRAYGFSRED